VLSDVRGATDFEITGKEKQRFDIAFIRSTFQRPLFLKIISSFPGQMQGVFQNFALNQV
jgi:hypothetical protein